MAKYVYEIWTGKWKAWVGDVDSVYNQVTTKVLYFDFTIKQNKKWNEVPLGEVVQVNTMYNGTQTGYKGSQFGLMSFDPATTQFDELYEKVSLVDTFVADESEYPEKSVYNKDKLLFRGEKVFPSLKLNGQTIGGAKIKDSVGQMRNVGNVYFKDSSGTVRNLK